MNWEHARHVEKQRNTLVLAYTGGMLAAGALALEKDAPFLVFGACFAGLFITLICAGMTHKWNIAFVNQIQKADLCARTLAMSQKNINSESPYSLHGFIGFPKRDTKLWWLNNRLMFGLIYGFTALFWLVVISFKVYNLSQILRGCPR